MLKIFFKPYGCRSFSNSRVLRSAEKDKNMIKSSETPQNVRPAGISMDFAPSEFDKIILVLSGRFKSKDSIPSRITYETMDNARSRFRIRGSNFLMVCTLALCGYYVWRGKKRVREGETITTIYTDMDKKILAEDQKSKQNQS